MRLSTHLCSGFLGSGLWITHSNIDFKNTIVGAIIIIFGSVFPDYDIRMGLEHRQITHSWFFWLVISCVVLSVFGSVYALLLFIPVLIHIFLDALTPTGVPLFFAGTKISFSNFVHNGFRTYGFMDNMIGCVCFLSSIYIYYSIFKNLLFNAIR